MVEVFYKKFLSRTRFKCLYLNFAKKMFFTSFMIVTTTVLAALIQFDLAIGVSNDDGVLLPPACGVNLNGKSSRPLSNGTLPDPLPTRKSKKDVNFAQPSRYDFRAQFAPIDFTFDVLEHLRAAKPGGGGRKFLLTVEEMPALSGEGVAMGMVHLEPCGVHLPHVHPRATELIFVLKADAMEVGILDGEAGSRYVVNTITTGQMTIIPRGLLHYQINRGCTNLTFAAFFNNEDFGIWYAPISLLDIKTDVVATALDIDEKLVQELRKGQPTISPAKGREECLKRCGLSQKYMQEQYNQPPTNPYKKEQEQNSVGNSYLDVLGILDTQQEKGISN